MSTMDFFCLSPLAPLLLHACCNNYLSGHPLTGSYLVLASPITQGVSSPALEESNKCKLGRPGKPQKLAPPEQRFLYVYAYVDSGCCYISPAWQQDLPKLVNEVLTAAQIIRGGQRRLDVPLRCCHRLCSENQATHKRHVAKTLGCKEATYS